MNLNRRRFLGAAAVSPMAARDIAEKAVEAAQMEATGSSLFGDSIYTGISTSHWDDDDDVMSPQRSIWQAIKDLGMPEWKRDDLWEDAKRSRTLDPDIASMRSLSLTSKLRMQWKRNFDVLVARAHEQERMEKLKRSFFKANPDVSEY
ncbi:MAG: hypothetical protein AAFR04_16095 [Pseudomonadota bacterium]